MVNEDLVMKTYNGKSRDLVRSNEKEKITEEKSPDLLFFQCNHRKPKKTIIRKHRMNCFCVWTIEIQSEDKERPTTISWGLTDKYVERYAK